MDKDRRTKLLEALKAAAENKDTEAAHWDADDALLAFIDDEEINEAYNNVAKWYS